FEGGPEAVGIHEVADADAGARHLVLVRGTDAATGRADLALATNALAGAVDGAMVRHDEVRLLADAEPAVVGEVAALAESVDLADQDLGVDHHARTHHANAAGVEDAGGDEVQHRLLAVHDQRVAGVVAAVEAHDHVGVGGEEIDDLPLPLVTPLGADDD